MWDSAELRAKATDGNKSSLCLAPVARASDELSVASWGPSTFETYPGLLSRSLSSGLAPNTNHHSYRHRPPHRSTAQAGGIISNSSGLLLGTNRDSFPAEANATDLNTTLTPNNPIYRFYADSEQPWAPPGLADPVPNAPPRRNAISQSHSASFDFRAGPQSDLGSASDSGYGSRLVDSQSCRSEDAVDSTGLVPELLVPLDSFQSFPNMSAFPPTPQSDGADSQQMNSTTARSTGLLEPCRICGVQSKCPSDLK